MHLRPTAMFTSAAAVVVLVLSAGCGSPDDKAVCDEIENIGDSFADEVAEFRTDPAGLSELYRTTAGEIRDAGSDASDGVQAAAGTVATEMEKLADVMAGVDVTNLQDLDLESFTSAGEALDAACPA